MKRLILLRGAICALSLLIPALAKGQVRDQISFVEPNDLPRMITAAKPDPQLKKRMLRIVTEELDLYPREFLAKTGLQRVVLCSKLRLSGIRLGGTVAKNAIYLDVENGGPYIRSTIHHELFHLFDLRTRWGFPDREWSRLNHPGFRYTHITPEHYDPRILLPGFGFVTPYSTTSVAEDKAEIFQLMIVDAKRVSQFVDADTILSLKVEYLKRDLKRFCQSIDECFWFANEDRN